VSPANRSASWDRTSTQARSRPAGRHLPAVQIILRPAKSHKFRFEYIPSPTTRRPLWPPTIVFKRHPLTPWVAGQFSARVEGRIGRLRGTTSSPRTAASPASSWKPSTRTCGSSSTARSGGVRARARAIPALAAIGRFYVMRNISITGEVTGVQDPRQYRQAATPRTTSTSTSTAR